MIYYLNLTVSILIILACFYIIYLVFKRNKKIIVKGHDDIFTIALIMFFVIIIFPITQTITLMEIVRNICIYTFLFSTFAINRGISEKGFEKVFFTVPWSTIEEIEISICQTAKFQVVCNRGSFHFKLIFKNIQLKKVLWELDKYHKNIKIEKALQDLLMKEGKQRRTL